MRIENKIKIALQIAGLFLVITQVYISHFSILIWYSVMP